MKTMYFLIPSLVIVVGLNCVSKSVSIQNSYSKFCGRFLYDNGFEKVRLSVHYDSTFEWSEWYDAGGRHPMTRGKWQTSDDTILLTTVIQPQILRVEESVKDGGNTITVSFFDRYGQNITNIAPIKDTLQINSDLKAYQRFWTTETISVKKTNPNDPTRVVSILFDRVPIVYFAKNSKANSFSFTFNFLAKDLRPDWPYNGYSPHFFLNEPLLFRNDAYCPRKDFDCYYSPEPESTSFKMHRLLERVTQ